MQHKYNAREQDDLASSSMLTLSRQHLKAYAASVYVTQESLSVETYTGEPHSSKKAEKRKLILVCE